MWLVAMTLLSAKTFRGNLIAGLCNEVSAEGTSLSGISLPENASSVGVIAFAICEYVDLCSWR
jgi:hypothetical protein